MNNNVTNLIFKLFDDVKRFQNNIDESLAITLGLVYLIYTDKESFISGSGMKDKNNKYPYLDIQDFYFDNIRNRMEIAFVNEQFEEYLVQNIKNYREFATFRKVDIKNAIESLLLDKCSILQASCRQTDRFTQKIITKIAKSLNSKGPYIDLALGTGSLLKDFDGEIWGDDINPKMVIIARCYLYFYLENVNYENLMNDIRLRDNIETFDYSDYHDAVLIFDPPMGDFRLYPKDEKWQNTEILPHSKPVKLQSEVLFLMNFLINANNNDFFIGLFPENILIKNSKEYNSIRKYLIENSLIAVIRVLTGHVLLIGKKKLDVGNFQEIPVIRIQTGLNEKQLDFIVSEIIKGNNFDFNKYLSIEPSNVGAIIREYDSIEGYNKDFRSITTIIYNRKDFKGNYLINLPSKITYEDIYKNKTESPKELLASLQEKEDAIKILMQNLSAKIANTELDSDNMNDELPKPLWFEEYNEKHDPELINALYYFYKMGYQLTPDNLDDYQDFQIRENMNVDSYKNLRTLYQDGRVKLLKTKAKIYFGNDEKFKFTEMDLNEFYNVFDPMNKTEIKSIIQMIEPDNNVKAIFEDLCRYWMLDQDEDNTLLKQKELPIKEFTRCLKVLENLGLVIFDKRKIATSEQEHSEIDLYKRFIPNIKYINAIKFEELQNVR